LEQFLLKKIHIDTGCLYITGNISNPGNNTSASLWNQSGIGPTFSGFQFVVQTNGTTERMRIDSSGNVGIGTNNPVNMLDVYTDNASINNVIRIRANTAREATLILERSGISWQIFHKGAGFGGAANNLTFSSSTNANVLDITQAGRIGVANTNPQSMLHLGNCEVVGSAPVIVFGKNVSGTSFRNAFMGYTDNFFFVIGDYGNTNAGANALTSQLAIIYNAPASSLVIETSGYVRMAYGFGNGSDERIKSNIKTIENALDKTLLLRGVEFNLNIEPERKRIGLIAQEVELIVPEVVRTSEDDGLKSIEYQNLVGLLIESIKDQQKQINELKNILIKNNLN
jgi:hypothetical protein